LTGQRAKEALHGISWFARSARRVAREQAAVAAQADAAAEQAQRIEGHRQAQEAADADWADLCANKPEAVIAAMEAAFEDNQSPAACVDADDDGVRYATIVVVFGTPDMVPEQKPALTPGGKPTLHKRTKSERNAIYAAALGSTVLATVKEGLAVSPGTAEIRLLVVRRDPQAARRRRSICRPSTLPGSVVRRRCRCHGGSWTRSKRY
jgi:hypothetical protein